MRKSLLCAFLAAGLVLLASPHSKAAAKTDFDICWTIYAGWMPWEYAAAEGIVDKWANKYGIQIKLTQVNDYVESINQYTAGQFDGCAMTNMDALTIPAAGGVDSTALIVGDFSNGNDGVVLKGAGKTVKDLKGMPVNLVELSVSHYLLARALDSAGLREKDLKVINTADADIAAAFDTAEVQAVTTWNPMLEEVKNKPGVTQVFDSSRIPGEILDLMVVNTRTLQDNPALGKALTGAWYEVMALLAGSSPQRQAAVEHMAKASGTDLDGFEGQLSTTYLFDTPQAALTFVTSAELAKTMDKVAAFSFDHGLLGEGARDSKAVGMSFANQVIVGDRGNLKLRFDPTYLQMAVDGSL
ncbi:putative urea ABC transporter substrate-binding protein [Pseudomonas sp. zfem002]|uniref:putative urea ABC transporter substrate-binding protein n=1 Tax=Pseudomonas sp. zfem002 TaxID=3078197 RepID=UPI0029297FEE|nr:putative urea ABC transporter substrate-binding protein [Pseudomonas sp. zfem002]MDU9392300.1 putative urea ABC transporter substrate-binding protein [Pseudomonas sp. zfem002]